MREDRGLTRRPLRAALLVLGILTVLLLVGPFLVPVPPLEGTVSPRDLADPDSQFIELRGIDVHFRAAGQGGPLIILLHGFAASVFSWREALERLGELGQVNCQTPSWSSSHAVATSRNRNVLRPSWIQ